MIMYEESMKFPTPGQIIILLLSRHKQLLLDHMFWQRQTMALNLFVPIRTVKFSKQIPKAATGILQLVKQLVKSWYKGANQLQHISRLPTEDLCTQQVISVGALPLSPKEVRTQVDRL